jgi:hypothetical protein
VVARWERELDADRMKRVLDGQGEIDDNTLPEAVTAIEPVPFVDQPE